MLQVCEFVRNFPQTEMAVQENSKDEQIIYSFEARDLETQAPFTRCRYDLKTAPLAWYCHESVTD